MVDVNSTIIIKLFQLFLIINAIIIQFQLLYKYAYNIYYVTNISALLFECLHD